MEEQLEQTLADIRFELRPISCPLHLAVGVPWVAKPTRAIERQAGRRDPLYPERFALAMGNKRRTSFGARGLRCLRGFRCTLRCGWPCLPEDCTACRIIDNSPSWRPSRGRRHGDFWSIQCVLHIVRYNFDAHAARFNATLQQS